MALALKIEFYIRDTLQAEFILEPQWWNPAELLAAYPFIPRSLNGYQDHSLLITKQQLKEIHEHLLHNIDLEHLPVLDDIVNSQLEYVINSNTEFRKIQINIYEWETSE